MEITTQSGTSQARQNVLPDEIIARLFERMACMYGRKFSDLWGGVDPHAVRKLWAEKLGVYPVEVIAKAITACDTRPFPPTLPEFILLCKAEYNRPQEFQALSAPVMDKSEAKARLAQCMKIVKQRAAA